MTKKLASNKFTQLGLLIIFLVGCSPITSATPSTEAEDGGNQITDTAEATPAVEASVTPDFALTATSQATSMKEDLQELADQGIIQNSDGRYYRVQDLTAEWAKLGYYHWWPLDRKPTNFAIRADAKWEIASAAANYAKAGCGFVYHELGANELHFSFLSMDGFVRTIRMEKGIFTDMEAKSAGKFRYPADSANFLLIVEDKWITFLVNNVVIIHFKDDHLAGGGLSLAVASGTNNDFGTRCQFQNVELWEFD
jgi:hypothetical protein